MYERHHTPFQFKDNKRILPFNMYELIIIYKRCCRRKTKTDCFFSHLWKKRIRKNICIHLFYFIFYCSNRFYWVVYFFVLFSAVKLVKHILVAILLPDKVLKYFVFIFSSLFCFLYDFIMIDIRRKNNQQRIVMKQEKNMKSLIFY